MIIRCRSKRKTRQVLPESTCKEVLFPRADNRLESGDRCLQGHASGWNRRGGFAGGPRGHGAATGVGDDRIAYERMGEAKQSPRHAADVAVLTPLPGVTRERIWGRA
jgi:hypothetical protein